VVLRFACQAVQSLRVGRRIVVVDGVGYPAVGSICGVSNADIARKLGAPVMLVGRKGVGDAVDAFNLNAAYFESFGVKVLGGVFNRLPDDASYYSLNKCKEAVSSYFATVGCVGLNCALAQLVGSIGR
jgi:dethiobiotin synthetase